MVEAKTALERACEAVGGISEMARQLGIKPPSISEWKARNRVPAERVLEVEKISGVSRYELRPDIFGPAPSEVRDAA